MAYLASLQRIAQRPLMLHARCQKARVRWAQRHTMHLTYPDVGCSQAIEVLSDVGARRAEDEAGFVPGQSLPDTNYMRLGVGRNACKRLCSLLGGHRHN